MEVVVVAAAAAEVVVQRAVAVVKQSLMTPTTPTQYYPPCGWPSKQEVVEPPLWAVEVAVGPHCPRSHEGDDRVSRKAAMMTCH